jgi:hypothetical protein
LLSYIQEAYKSFQIGELKMQKLLLSFVTTLTLVAGLSANATCRGGTATGTIAGGLVGGILGNQIGGGSGQQAATILGALGGAALGSNQQQRQNNEDCGYQNQYPQPRGYERPAPTREPYDSRGYSGESRGYAGQNCRRVQSSYWDGYQQVTTVTTECDNSYQSSRYGRMSCQAQDIYSGQLFAAVSGSPSQQASLERRALWQCESRQGRGECEINECVVF